MRLNPEIFTELGYVQSLKWSFNQIKIFKPGSTVRIFYKLWASYQFFILSFASKKVEFDITMDVENFMSLIQRIINAVDQLLTSRIFEVSLASYTVSVRYFYELENCLPVEQIFRKKTQVLLSSVARVKPWTRNARRYERTKILNENYTRHRRHISY